MKNLVFAIMMMVCGISFAQDQFVTLEVEKTTETSQLGSIFLLEKTMKYDLGIYQIPAGSIVIEKPSYAYLNYSYLAVPMPLNLNEAVGFVPVEESEMIRIQQIILQKKDTSFMQNANFYFPLFKEKDCHRGVIFTDDDLGTANNTEYYVYRLDIGRYSHLFGVHQPLHNMTVRMRWY